MHIKDLDLNLLAVLDAMLRERNVSQAAQALGISRATLYRKLRNTRP